MRFAQRLPSDGLPRRVRPRQSVSHPVATGESMVNQISYQQLEPRYRKVMFSLFELFFRQTQRTHAHSKRPVSCLFVLRVFFNDAPSYNFAWLQYEITNDMILCRTCAMRIWFIIVQVIHLFSGCFNGESRETKRKGRRSQKNSRQKVKWRKTPCTLST